MAAISVCGIKWGIMFRLNGYKNRDYFHQHLYFWPIYQEIIEGSLYHSDQNEDLKDID